MLCSFLLFVFPVAAASLQASSSFSGSASTVKRYDPAAYGLPEGSMLINDIAMGFLPDFASGETISELNAVLPLPMSIVGDYISVTPWDTSLSEYYKQQDDFYNQANTPVYMATIMAEDGTSTWDSTQADAVSYAMNTLNQGGYTVWVRFMYEMNGCPAWNAWGCDPAGFLAAWDIMAQSLRANAPGCYMLWNPNVDANSTGHGPNYAEYYPGDDTVDIIGLDLYTFGVDQHDNTPPPAGFLEENLAPFYDVYVAPKNKPFIIAETAAAYHYLAYTSTPAPGGDSEYDIKTQWFDQLFGTSTKERFPLMIGAVWFNYMKDEVRNGTEQTVDYRAVLGNSAVQNAVYHLVVPY